MESKNTGTNGTEKIVEPKRTGTDGTGKFSEPKRTGPEPMEPKKILEPGKHWPPLLPLIEKY